MEPQSGDAVVAPPLGGHSSVDEVFDGDTIERPVRRENVRGEKNGGAPEQADAAPPAEETTLRRPPAPNYGFRVNDHSPITLDRPARIGRNPVQSRVPDASRPRLVRVPSPGQLVSGTHLEIRQRGGAVVVTDLRASNGTVVTIPGSAPSILRPGDSIVVTPGSIIDIGDGNRIEILTVSRLAAPRTPDERQGL